MSRFDNRLYFIVNLVFCFNFVRSDPYAHCMEMFNPDMITLMCCEGLLISSNSTVVCQKSRMDPCHQARCELNKYKLLKPDGGINEGAIDTFLDKFEKAHPRDKGMAQRVRSYCLDGQYEDYVPPNQNLCNPIRFLICGYVNAMVECARWKPSPECEKVAETSRQCRIALNSGMK